MHGFTKNNFSIIFYQKIRKIPFGKILTDNLLFIFFKLSACNIPSFNFYILKIEKVNHRLFS